MLGSITIELVCDNGEWAPHSMFGGGIPLEEVGRGELDGCALLVVSDIAKVQPLLEKLAAKLMDEAAG